MAGRGPIPKRADQRHGHISKAARAAVTKAPTGVAHIDFPPPAEDWHPLARDWYLSLAHSGQTAYYEPSDVAVAVVWSEVLSRQLYAERISAVMIQAWASSAAELLTTEGSRRRARLELERGVGDRDEEASVTMLDAYRAKFDPDKGWTQ
jgi:hypothetical protein